MQRGYVHFWYAGICSAWSGQVCISRAERGGYGHRCKKAYLCILFKRSLPSIERQSCVVYISCTYCSYYQEVKRVSCSVAGIDIILSVTCDLLTLVFIIFLLKPHASVLS